MLGVFWRNSLRNDVWGRKASLDHLQEWWCRWGFLQDKFPSLVPTMRGSKRSWPLPYELQSNRRCWRIFLEVMPSMWPFLQTVHTGVSNEARPDSVHKTCPLKNRAQNAVVCPAVYDSVMLQIMFLHLECYSNNTQIPNQRIVWAWAVHEESDVLRHKSLVHFCSCLGTVAWLISVSVTWRFASSSRTANNGRAFCCFSP
jgi:hypothetical protein